MSYMLVMHRCNPDVNDLYLDVRYAANIETMGDPGLDPAWVVEEASIVRQPLLALLAKEPAHGYELKLALEQTFGAAYPSPNIGQIYVTLKRLEADGLGRSQDVEQTTRPNKRVYELTPAGRDAVAAWVEQPSDSPRIRDDFFMKLALSPLTGGTDLMALINRQRRHYLGLMRGLSRLAAAGGRGTRVTPLAVGGGSA